MTLHGLALALRRGPPMEEQLQLAGSGTPPESVPHDPLAGPVGPPAGPVARRGLPLGRLGQRPSGRPAPRGTRRLRAAPDGRSPRWGSHRPGRSPAGVGERRQRGRDLLAGPHPGEGLAQDHVDRLRLAVIDHFVHLADQVGLRRPRSSTPFTP